MSTRMDLLADMGLISNDMSETAKMATGAVLAGYTDDQLREAYIEHIRVSPYAMKVCDVVAYWQKRNGTDKAGKERKADEFLQALDKDFSVGVDCLCADKIAVAAFKTSFGGLSGYGARPSYLGDKDRAKFREIYVATAIFKSDARIEDFVLPGIYHHQGHGRYRLIGDVSHDLIEAYEAAFPTMKQVEPFVPRAAIEYRHEEIVSDPQKLNEILNALMRLTGGATHA